MPYYKKTEYNLLGYEKSNYKYKKYNAILENKKTNKIIKIPFGDKRYQHFKDTTGLGLYSNLDHNDKARRKNYRARHGAIKLKSGKLAYLDTEQPSYYSYKYLW